MRQPLALFQLGRAADIMNKEYTHIVGTSAVADNRKIKVTGTFFVHYTHVQVGVISREMTVKQKTVSTGYRQALKDYHTPAL